MAQDELPQPSLWLGSINGLHAVVDPSIQVDQSRWVIIYIALHGVTSRFGSERTIAAAHNQ